MTQENGWPAAKFMRQKTKIHQTQPEEEVKEHDASFGHRTAECVWGNSNSGDEKEEDRRKKCAGHWPQAKNQSSVVQNGLYPFIFYLRSGSINHVYMLMCVMYGYAATVDVCMTIEHDE